ncbi:UDP-N-acetylglucosamine--N-acetylmuramyl-(pentapeptide) pyrophosphoryl-undecaprenol N-acetylglucosamine transferase [Tepiditoga spiralis]|uniref:UDP-N-acetylglucosamine--N-acetylmuramyl-(Pentapeptide) pyrophosphoryl-undecaprenol N-acetylglucosamine transferase n=1 Tax=Tepiditoga spiralis TaxID=2108365 RepID=A0A7G1G5Q2_9BACT|nr:UDP-N-acetylglucosamine--N-acetylmuramyl-(pentapeptide) pyrophosphoryl-undecaprenol N-acetylglucosamine transferase [Tepiditoga spiralis]BBE30374.1 UDP-N-acetylglucosamine--N-acetylmuramyl-(pentapeptide) pyrophosphoryl-undecaprenol N-acetylglucosamine transferase [Tepiditoga spiralis]
MKKIKVIVSGGGTGGHYTPALSFIKYLDKKYDLEVLYFVTKGRIEQKKLKKDFPKAKMEVVNLTGLKRPLYKLQNIKIILLALKETFRIKKIIKKFNPDFGFLTGGYVVGPVGKALSQLKIPFYLHEQNSIMGITNKLLSKKAKKVFTSFEMSPFIKTGNPVRIPEKEVKRSVLKNYNLDPSKKTLLIMAGSLGSEQIDDIMYNVYKKNNDINFIHITKNKNKFKEFKNVKTYEYLDNIYEIMSICDGGIFRGGATTIAEILFYELKCAIIPWSNASENHQFKNALKLKEMGLAEVFDEKNIDYNKLQNFIEKIEIKNTDFIWNIKEDESIKNIVKNIDEF